jgi:serine/threonine-protein kinase
LPVVAVLPFDSLKNSGDSDVDQWSDALTEEITDALARMPEIRVVARTSAMRFKGVRSDIREMAEALGANVVIEGSLQREGDQLRAIAQLITANDGLHLWSDAVDGDAKARFRFFDTVCAVIRRAMPLAVRALHHETGARQSRSLSAAEAPQSGEHFADVHADVPEAARDAYERGRIAIRIRTTASLARATALFTEVVAAAPEFARGHSARAAALFQEVGMTMQSPTDVAVPMRESIAKALSLDPQLPEAHATLGMFLLYYEHDWPNAERSLLRAIHFGPSYVSAHRAYAFGLMLMRRFDEADRSFMLARALDPLDAQTRVHHALLRFYQRRFDEAREMFEGMLDTDASNVLARTLLAATHLHSSNLARAEALYRDTISRHPDLSIGLCGLAVTLAYATRVDEAKAVRNSLVEFSNHSFVSRYQFAMIDCALGDTDAALAALEQAASTGDFNFLCSAVDPTFERLHGTPEWIALMQLHGLPHD